MNKKLNYIFSLIPVGLISFVAFAASVHAQNCTPVVYAFRHAEDFGGADAKNNKPSGGPYGFLSKTGAAHADLYPDMIKTLAELKGYCPVTRVYAASPTGNDGKAKDQIDYNGAVNSFCTARPLAKSLSPQQTWTPPENSGNSASNPLCINAMGEREGVLTENDPIMFIDGVGLDQYLNGSDDPGSLLRHALLANAGENASSAIFWTSQGLHSLGNAIIDGTSAVPVKNGGNTPGRNAVYIFTPKVTDNLIIGFNDTSLDYFQCFNWTNFGDMGLGRMRTNNWCGKSDGTKLGGSMGDDKKCTLEGLKNNDALCTNQIPLKNLPGGTDTQLNGKICNIEDSEPGFIKEGSAGYVGYCTP